MTEDEPEVRRHSPMPKGYKFVAKGDVYIIKHCRKKTHEAGKTLYVVVDKKGKPMGLRCPAYIHNAVMRENEATASQRAEAVQKRDTAIQEGFENAIVKLFPKIPKGEVLQILKHSLKKHSRRVGRTGTVALQDRVKLAVRAHIRHEGMSRQDARERIWGRLNEIARQWSGRALKPAAGLSVEGRRGKEEKRKKNKKESTAVASSNKSNKPKSVAIKTVIPPNSPTGGRAGLRVRTRQMTREHPATESEDVVILDELDNYLEDAAFTLSEETSDDDSDGSEWSNITI
ncbi:hypothetical protein C7999DRAFT_42393 [Corynascus novoguineensis]|uniref:DUF2293 domain-containing protein n=1 Tax=Corynascus novoguineensis TaxID=1126955 RepID=A0AAN7HNL1_9PEZI|nr:hypothetical protein C7999DRAFT_42393 [Corynascus novoguineensis]